MQQDIINRDDYSDDGNGDYLKYIKVIFGVVLLVGGIIIAGWVFLKIVGIFDNPNSLSNFITLLPQGKEVLIFRIENTSFELPKELFNGLNFLFAIILLSISVSLAAVLITGGVNLLHSGLKRVEDKIDKVTNKVDRLREKIR